MKRSLLLACAALGVAAPAAGAVTPQATAWGAYASLKAAPAQATLGAMQAPSATGLALFEQRDHALQIAVKVRLLAPFTRYDLTIQTGPCQPPTTAPPAGMLSRSLPDLISDADGTARLDSTVTTATGAQWTQAGVEVVVAAEPPTPVGAATPPPPVVVACGPVVERASHATGVVHRVHNETVRGRVELRQAADKVSEAVTIWGLAPASTHVQSVNQGTCAAFGATVITLPDAAASVRGRIHTHLSITPVTSRVVHNHTGYVYLLRLGPTGIAGPVIGCAPLHGTYAPSRFNSLMWWINWWL
jgi:hypothetical protein